MKWIFFLSLILTISCEETTLLSQSNTKATAQVNNNNNNNTGKSESRFLTLNQHSHVNSKVRSYYQVEVKRLASATGEVLLQANVTTMSPYANTHIEWQLPRDMQPVEGDLQEVFDAQSGISRQFQILINEEHLQEKDQIFVFVYHMVGDTRYGLSQSYVYSTKTKEAAQPKSLDKSKKSHRFLQ